VCLFCGHAFCLNHRGERGGVAACVPCLEAEAARAAAAARRSTAVAAGADAPASGAPAAAAAPAAPRPHAAPADKGWRPVGWALVAAAPTGAYLYWLLGWLAARHPLPAWGLPVGVAAGAAFAFVGVWAIVKSR